MSLVNTICSNHLRPSLVFHPPESPTTILPQVDVGSPFVYLYLSFRGHNNVSIHLHKPRVSKEREKNAMENTATIDEQALHVLYEQLIDAWNKGNGQAYGSVFTEDASYVDVTGTNTQGSQAIGTSHQHMFQTFLKGSQLVATITSIRFLRPDVALLHVRGETRLAGQAELAPDRGTIETAIAVKEQGKWLFAALQNTRIMQMPPRQ
jgi:uncharacterized protein (TIGR02246 family)